MLAPKQGEGPLSFLRFILPEGVFHVLLEGGREGKREMDVRETHGWVSEMQPTTEKSNQDPQPAIHGADWPGHKVRLPAGALPAVPGARVPSQVRAG